MRELREETGLTAETLELRGVVHVTLPEPPGVVFFVFVGEAAAGGIVASEEGVPEWVEREAMAGLPSSRTCPHCCPGF